ncbi:MAG TPA: hypothetical protein VN799_04960 [Acidimicrobiales bacterium]|nr:hypothetical protein [Acidimicrobiales bacterium]
MTDLDQTAQRLRASLDELVADVPTVAPPRSEGAHRLSPSPVSADRRWGWRRPVALVSIAVAASVVVAAVVTFGPRSTSPSTAGPKHPVKHIGAADAPPGWINLPMLLPSAPAVLENATVANGPVPVPSTGTYAQVYEGAQTTDPVLLLITTVVAQPGALADYATNTQAVTVHGTPAYMTNGSHHQLVWQTADGVVVSLESTGMTSSDVLAAGQLVEPHPATQLGVDVSGVLPDGLVFTGEGFANENTGQNQDTVFFHQGTCHAYTTVWAGSAADFAPVVVVSDATRLLSIGGTPVLSVQFGTSTSALLWSEGPGIDVRLQGSFCDLPSIAAALKVVDPATWQSELSSLGSKATFYTPQPPTTSATLPGPGTFGLAH